MCIIQFSVFSPLLCGLQRNNPINKQIRYFAQHGVLRWNLMEGNKQDV